ncbi:MAG: hypothetical protein HYZ44_13605 [Bacteroidetes bacterium]|nr:hypothetical protein [Bacteroidota bacterium]
MKKIYFLFFFFALAFLILSFIVWVDVLICEARTKEIGLSIDRQKAMINADEVSSELIKNHIKDIEYTNQNLELGVAYLNAAEAKLRSHFYLLILNGTICLIFTGFYLWFYRRS